MDGDLSSPRSPYRATPQARPPPRPLYSELSFRPLSKKDVETWITPE